MLIFEYNYPYPEQMGAMMYRLSQLRAESLDGSMQEMISKFEAGISIEAIEDEFVGLFDHEFADVDSRYNNMVYGNSTKYSPLKINNPLRSLWERTEIVFIY